MTQDNNNVMLRMECLRLACAVTHGDSTPTQILEKAAAFAEYVEGSKSTIVIPKLVTN